MLKAVIVAPILMVASACSLALSEERPTSVCRDNVWSVISEPDADLKVRIGSVRQVVDIVKKRGFVEWEAHVMPINCPAYGRPIIVIRLPSMPEVAATSFRLVRQYGIYVTAATLRNTDEATLRYSIIEQSCLIREGFADDLTRFEDGKRASRVLRCMIEATHEAGDDERIEWLSRLHVEAVIAERSISRSEQGLSNAIELLKQSPHAPPGALETLERFKRSLEK